MLFQVASSLSPDGKHLVFRNTCHKFHRRHRTCFYQLTNISNLLFPHVAWTSPDRSFTRSYLFTSSIVVLGTCLDSNLRLKYIMPLKAAAPGRDVFTFDVGVGSSLAFAHTIDALLLRTYIVQIVVGTTWLA